MEILFTGKKPNVDTLIKVGNVGENNVDTLTFIIQRFYRDIDLSIFSPSIEWSRKAGGADFSTDVSFSFDNEKITIVWTLGDYFLNTAGKAFIRIVLKNETTKETWISDILNLFISGGLDLTQEIEKNYPENYRELWNNVFQVRSDIEAGLLKGDKGDKGDTGSINFPVFSIDGNMNLIVEDLDNPIFDLTDGTLTLEVY